MSIIYCHIHDVNWDSDYDEDCPHCLNEKTEDLIQRGESVSSENLNKLWDFKVKSMKGGKEKWIN